MQQLLEQGFVLCQQSSAGFCDYIGPFYEQPVAKAEVASNESLSFIRAFAVDERHLNPEGVVNGGAVLSYMDYVIYRAIGDELTHDVQFATINLNSNFLAAAKKGDVLYGKGRIVRKTRSVIFAEGEIYTEERPIMTASGIWKLIGK